MSEKQKEALERLNAALTKIPDKKLEYLQGYADALSDMNSEDVQEEKKEEVAVE